MSDHLCGVSTGNGWCKTELDKHHPRCDKHAVLVFTKSHERKYVPVEGVKLGDKIIRPVTRSYDPIKSLIKTVTKRNP